MPADPQRTCLMTCWPLMGRLLPQFSAELTVNYPMARLPAKGDECFAARERFELKPPARLCILWAMRRQPCSLTRNRSTSNARLSFPVPNPIASSGRTVEGVSL